MAITYGFYNSLNGDRKYNAEDVSHIFNGIITDGVFSAIGDAMITVAGSGMQVIVKTGKCWFNGTWTINDTQLPLDIDAADVNLTRIDAVVIEINNSTSVRANTIKVIKGTPSANPYKPELTKSELINQYALSYITVSGGATSISASNIENNVGKTGCPFITAVLQQADITDIFDGWSEEFNTWFSNIQSQLSGDVAANLQHQITELADEIDDVRAEEEGHLSSYTKQLLGLPDTAKPDDAFQALTVGTSNKAFRVTVKFPNGDPAVGFTIGGLTALPTTTLVTDQNGMAMGKASGSTATITVAKKYDDIKAASVSATATGTITDVLITLEYDETLTTITSSRTISLAKMSPYIKTLEYLIVGGGGGGGCGTGIYTNSNGHGGDGGGGGGYSKTGVINGINSEMSLKVVVGAGGSHGQSTTSAGKGGTTSITTVVGTSETLVDSISGGNPGSVPTTNSGGYSGSDGGAGGTGNGNGGTGGYAYYERDSD